MIVLIVKMVMIVCILMYNLDELLYYPLQKCISL
jgi:hypothetical protein